MAAPPVAPPPQAQPIPLQNPAAQPFALQNPVPSGASAPQAARGSANAPNPYAAQPQQPAGNVARDPFAAPPRSAGPAQIAPGVAASSLHPPSPPSMEGHTINADLGTQSPTNFYKGLSGNDIIEHGGLFVSTYMSPPIGTPVRLKISLPGGYEFEANAIVSWAREQSDDNAAPPGFGAKFTQITPEARQLVYRYTRNREPLFHDDL
jgi:hypothetical protein